MTLQETTRLINWVASKQPNVNGIIETGDILELNNSSWEQKYSVVCATQESHQVTGDFYTFNFVVYYVDRLTFDKKNQLEVQSTAIEVLANIANSLNVNNNLVDVVVSSATTFTEKFVSECAGAWVNISITTPKWSVCEIIKEEFGQFAPAEFSDDFFKFVLN